jgi:hypothetical protein
MMTLVLSFVTYHLAKFKTYSMQKVKKRFTCILFMKKIILSILMLAAVLIFKTDLFAQGPAPTHPNTSEAGWTDLFKPDLSNAIFPKNVWSVTNGIYTATKDEALWSEKKYENFIVDLEFKTVNGSNSGVFVHASDLDHATENSVEIQITDDFDPEWGNSPPNWQCGSIFGHQAPAIHNVKKPGVWNHYTITCIGRKIWVVLNNELVNVCDLSLFTSAKKNPDGTSIPEWLSKPYATIELTGHVGFQGKHAGKPIFFRNIKIKEL